MHAPPADRVGSVAVRVNPSGTNEKLRYYPYGEERVATASDRDKFATYFRDSSTGLDYAMNRYYGSNMGRFLTSDPYGPSAKPGNPQSWNRYAYVSNDPVNKNDPTGLLEPGLPSDAVDYCDMVPNDPACGRQTNTFVDDWQADQERQERVRQDQERDQMILNATALALTALAIDGCAELFRGVPADVGNGQNLLTTLTAPGNPYGVIGHQDLGPTLPYTAITVKYGPGELSVVALNSNARHNAFDYHGLQKALTPVEGLAAILIHELGHVAGQQFGYNSTMLLPDGEGEPPGNSTSNQRAVEERCFPDAPRR